MRGTQRTCIGGIRICRGVGQQAMAADVLASGPPGPAAAVAPFGRPAAVLGEQGGCGASGGS